MLRGWHLLECTHATHACPQGPRNCLGQHLALLEARVVLALLAHRFTFKLAVQGQGKRHPSVIPIGPVGGMKVHVY